LYKKGYGVFYSFEYGSHIYDDHVSSSNYSKFKFSIVGKKFPVILRSDSPSVNQILILPDDFKTYNIEIPDSLKWVGEIGR
jgi:hypothetical protein